MDEPDAVYHLVGGLLYLVVIVLTVVYHVPKNDALAAIDPAGNGAAEHWSRYPSGGTAGNHVRTIASIAAAGCMTVAVRVG
jgi:uncharacterized membrane protein